MEWMNGLPIWALMILIFVLRITDVSFGTMRTLAVVEGRVQLAVFLGFFEVGIWVTAISQVITRLNESVCLILAYAAGYAAGNAVGLMIERRFSFGSNVIRLFSANAGPAIAAALRARGQVLTTFNGEGRDGAIMLLYISCSRRETDEVLALARRLDPDIFYNIERAAAAPRPDFRHPHAGILLRGTLRSILKLK